MSSALVLASSNGERKTYSAEYRAAVKRTMRRREYRDGAWVEMEISEEEVDFLLFKAVAYGLDPLKGQIYATWRSGRIQVEATFDGLRSLAERTGKYRGQTKPEWCDREGNWSDIWLQADPPAASRVGILRDEFPEPLCVPVHWSEFKQTQRNGDLVAMWKEKPAHMLAKTSASLGLRAAFPEVASGLYTDVEMAGIGAAEEEPPQTVGEPQRSSSQRGTEPQAKAPEAAGPAAIVDDPASQPSGPPAMPATQGTLGEALQRGGYARLRVELAKLAFDQQVDRLTDAQAERLASALSMAAEAGITAVELERTCKRGVKHTDVALRQKALFQWIEERHRRASRVQAGKQRNSGARKEAAEPPRADAGGRPATLIDHDRGPQAQR